MWHNFSMTSRSIYLSASAVEEYPRLVKRRMELSFFITSRTISLSTVSATEHACARASRPCSKFCLSIFLYEMFHMHHHPTSNSRN